MKVARESGGQQIELGNGQITGYNYTNTSPTNFLAKTYNVVHSIQIRGKIPLRLLPPVVPEMDNSNTLYAWALTEYRPDNDYYRTVTVQIVRHEKTIREVNFTHAYVHAYNEQVNGMKGVLEFELVVRQKRDQLDYIQFGSVESIQQHSVREKESRVTTQKDTPKIAFWGSESQKPLSAQLKPLKNADTQKNGKDQLTWEYNKRINDQKIALAKAKKSGNSNEVADASKKIGELRTEYENTLQKQMTDAGLQGPVFIGGNLLGKDDEVLTYHDIASDEGIVETIATSKNGTVYFLKDSNYTYDVQVHKPTMTEEWHGKTAKALAGFYAGSYLTMGKAWYVILGSGGTGAVLTDNLLGSAPDSEVTKTMIYRTNKETGKIENMIIDTNGYLPIQVRYWKEYR